MLGIANNAILKAMEQPTRQSKAPTRHRSPSMEDYLEAIRTLSDEHGKVRVTHLSETLHVSKPSVTAAIARLSAEGLVSHERYGAVELTRRGQLVADDVWKRHEALWVFLTEILGLDEETAETDACRLEHYLSPETSKRLTRFVDLVLRSEQGRPAWLTRLSRELSADESQDGS
jgi:DtxR family Mn-dependent transcriptional regulator